MSPEDENTRNPAPAATATDRPARFGPWRREGGAFLELLAVCGIALTQPALSILEKNPAIFVAQGTTGFQLILLTIGLVLGAPLVLWGAEVVVGLVLPAARRVVHLAFVGLVVTAIGIQVLKKQTDFGSSVLLLGGIVIGVLGALLVMRFDIVQLWLRFLAVAPLIFAVLFLISEPVSTVVFSSGESTASGAEVGKPSRVVMVVMDEFPVESLLDGTGKVDAALFPNFAALANGSTWYRNDATVAPYTEAAVPALLTGQLPEDPGLVPVAASYPENLFTLLGDKYQLNVHERITRLCPKSLCAETTRDEARTSGGLRRLARETLDLWADDASPERQPTEINLGKIADANQRAFATGQQFVASLKPATQPQLDYLHVLLPHQGWHYIGTGQNYEQTGVAPGLVYYSWTSDWAARSGKQRHLLQLQAADTLLGEIFAKLRSFDEYDSSLVVVTADHGVAFDNGDSFRGVSMKNYDQIMWTPLFIKHPGQVRGKVDDRRVRSIDVLPTMADILKTRIPWKIDGQSVLGAPKPDGPREVFEWDLNVAKPPAGKQYIRVDGPAGFAEAMKGQASAATGDPRLRLYRLGPYGDLVGVRAAPLVASGSGPTGTLEQQDQYRQVRVAAKRTPWLYFQGKINAGEVGQNLAVTVNGVVAGLAQTAIEPGVAGRTRYWGLLAPEAFHDGANEVEVFAIEGSPTAPRLLPVRIGE